MAFLLPHLFSLGEGLVSPTRLTNLSMWLQCGLLLLLVAPLAQPAAHKWRSDDGKDLSKMYDTATPNPTGSLSGPWFDINGSGNVTGVVGRTSHLACRVKNRANQTVSWVRHKDTHLLTAGLYEYTQDPRISAIHRSNSEDWVLEIRQTSIQDAGVYGCQVSTTPVRSHQVHLSVAEPITTIHGGLERHIKYGSLINLTCEIRDYPDKLNFVIWYRNQKSLVKNPRYNISLIESRPNLTVSRLIVQAADQSDTGNYACSSDAGSSNITAIHVITGETRAGLQVNSSPSLWSDIRLLQLLGSTLALFAATRRLQQDLSHTSSPSPFPSPTSTT